ncbi:hypothetical protein MMJ46_08260 [Enterococcus cecorum]|uniref:hypothetical protein n=1 Tax=Enterococcus cecorum TaxID=44008 RepID=UPI001FAD8AD0|nr:hypothetical protein [Enterococcus cecorum]MCJ0597289.1 hypothetical protein [Enterococcus cecorum]
MTKRDIVDIYLECGDFHQAVKESGLPVHVAHIKLLKSGQYPILGDKKSKTKWSVFVKEDR